LNHDTDLGGPAANFPATHCSLVRAAGSPDPAIRRQAQDALIAAYWKPVYKYIRVRWRSANEEAKDLTQSFFAAALEKGFFDRFDPTKARFRTFVRLCVDGFVAKEHRAGERLKRGGGVAMLPLDFAGAEGELGRLAPAAKFDPEDFFRQEWLRGLFAAAVDDLRQRCAASDKDLHFQLFASYDLEGPDAAEKPTYAGLARAFGVPETQITNHLALARRLFRQFVLERLRAATATEEEYQDEVWRLFGGDVR
jgi:DNA-directed RNA polymerase specialized sigma24 family protein